VPRFEESIELYDDPHYLPPMEPPVRPLLLSPSAARRCPPKIEHLQKSGYRGVVFGPENPEPSRFFPCRYHRPVYGDDHVPRPSTLPVRWSMAPLGVPCETHCQCHRDAFSAAGNEKLLFWLRVLGGCNESALELGKDLPAVVSEYGGKTCVLGSNADEYTCSGRHPKTQRLCPCLDLRAIDRPRPASGSGATRAAGLNLWSVSTWAFLGAVIYIFRKFLRRCFVGTMFAAQAKLGVGGGVRQRTIQLKLR
jgi:hypothetical protein